MSQRSEIVATPNPKGVFLEGYLTNAASGLKPGSFVSFDPASSQVHGRWGWKPYTASEGAGLVAVLKEDHLQGRDENFAYQNDDRIFMYAPLPGEEVLGRVPAATGTGDSVSGGDLFDIDDGTGLLTTGTNPCPFIATEDVVDEGDVDLLVTVRYTGQKTS